MKKLMILAILVAGFVSVSNAAHAVSAEELELQLFQTQKKLIVLQNMGMTPTEQKAFWPVYDKYQAALVKINRRMGETIQRYAKEYEKLDGAEAGRLLDAFLLIQEDRIKLKRTYVKKFKEVLPEKKVTRFYQIENKLETEMLFEIAKSVPLIKK